MRYVAQFFFGREMVDFFVNEAAIGIYILVYYFTLACDAFCHMHYLRTLPTHLAATANVAEWLDRRLK